MSFSGEITVNVACLLLREETALSPERLRKGFGQEVTGSQCREVRRLGHKAEGTVIHGAESWGTSGKPNKLELQESVGFSGARASLSHSHLPPRGSSLWVPPVSWHLFLELSPESEIPLDPGEY